MLLFSTTTCIISKVRCFHENRIVFVVSGHPNTPRALLQIGYYTYILVPGASPCYKTDYGAFIIPDIHSHIPGNIRSMVIWKEAIVAYRSLLNHLELIHQSKQI